MEKTTRRVGRPCADVRTTAMSVRLPEAAVERLVSLAAKRGITSNQMARIIILRGLNQDYSLGTAMDIEEVAKRELQSVGQVVQDITKNRKP